MFIPEIGDEIQLTEDWNFNLYLESRNESLISYLGLSEESFPKQIGKYWEPNFKMVYISASLPAGSIFRIDRIYIRKGRSEFSSISFIMQGVTTQKSYSSDKTKEIRVRFWAKLSDINQINFKFL